MDKKLQSLTEEDFISIDLKGHTNSIRFILPDIQSHLVFEMLLDEKKAGLLKGNDPFTSEGRANILEIGLRESVSRPQCAVCGEHYKIFLRQGKKLEASTPCNFAKGFPEISVDLNVPSGEIILFNDLREEYASRDESMQFDINTTMGIKQYTEFYAKRGLAIHFVGNTCPGVYQCGNKLIIGSLWEDQKKIFPHSKKIGSICTDLWWYCAVDKAEFEKRANKTVDQWEKEYHATGAWPNLVRAKVAPGVYQTTGRYHLIENEGKPGIFSVIELKK